MAADSASITNMLEVKKFMAHGRVEDTRVAFRQEGPAMWQEVTIQNL